MAFTFFFRDEQTLKVLLEHALPVLQGQAFIRIWDAGCAHGPEPYTLAILLRERMSAMLFRNVRIHATDLERNSGTRSSRAYFPKRSLAAFPRRYCRSTSGRQTRTGLRVGGGSKWSTRCGAHRVHPARPAFARPRFGRTCR